MVLKIEIDLDNSAFGLDPADEVSRILKDFVRRMRREMLEDGSVSLYDINGNRVGFAAYAK